MFDLSFGCEVFQKVFLLVSSLLSHLLRRILRDVPIDGPSLDQVVQLDRVGFVSRRKRQVGGAGIQRALQKKKVASGYILLSSHNKHFPSFLFFFR